jgi:hypothetical protein
MVIKILLYGAKFNLQSDVEEVKGLKSKPVGQHNP